MGDVFRLACQLRSRNLAVITNKKQNGVTECSILKRQIHISVFEGQLLRGIMSCRFQH